ncbi:MAG: helix-turn-helix transcriptional regulator [Hespellia sp.]|nr:helix-turn-helix transcriptional regulator [Hespellia sp.]
MFKTNYDAVEFGKRLKMVRKKAGMTQEMLAEELILSVDSISRIENGKVMCMPEHLVHICETLNITSDYLYFGEKKIDGNENNRLTHINQMLANCNGHEIERLKKMMVLFLDR